MYTTSAEILGFSRQHTLLSFYLSLFVLFCLFELRARLSPRVQVCLCERVTRALPPSLSLSLFFTQPGQSLYSHTHQFRHADILTDVFPKDIKDLQQQQQQPEKNRSAGLNTKKHPHTHNHEDASTGWLELCGTTAAVVASPASRFGSHVSLHAHHFRQSSHSGHKRVAERTGASVADHNKHTGRGIRHKGDGADRLYDCS